MSTPIRYPDGYQIENEMRKDYSCYTEYTEYTEYTSMALVKEPKDKTWLYDDFTSMLARIKTISIDIADIYVVPEWIKTCVMAASMQDRADLADAVTKLDYKRDLAIYRKIVARDGRDKIRMDEFIDDIYDCIVQMLDALDALK
jgi:hypothetical protein